MMYSKDDEILIKNTIDRVSVGKSSKFLNERELNIIIPFLNKKRIYYNIYYPYVGSDKGIIYCDILPSISCLQILSKKKLEHKDILGSIFGLSIDIHNFGDIIISNDKYYVVLLNEFVNYVKCNLLEVGRYSVSIEEVDFSIVNEYKREYELLTIIVSSSRVDAVIARLLNISRSSVEKLFKEKLVVLNNMVFSKSSYILKEDDTFSIKGKGKYKFCSIEKTTKSGGLIININKYR